MPESWSVDPWKVSSSNSIKLRKLKGRECLLEFIKNEKLIISICTAGDDFYRQLLRRVYILHAHNYLKPTKYQCSFENLYQEKAYQMEKTAKFSPGLLKLYLNLFPVKEINGSHSLNIDSYAIFVDSDVGDNVRLMTCWLPCLDASDKKVCRLHFSACWWHSYRSSTSLYARMRCWWLIFDVGA